MNESAAELLAALSKAMYETDGTAEALVEALPYYGLCIAALPATSPPAEPTVCAVCGIPLPDDAAAREHLGTALLNERLSAARRKAQAEDHPYESGSDNVCIHCGQIGSYAHTPEAQARFRAQAEEGRP